jgi:RNA polymerase sigma factor (sigma-70 family)
MICYNGCGSFITFLYHRLSGVFRHLRDSEIRARRTQSVPFGTIMDVDAVISYCDVESRTTVQECLECLDGKELEIITELFFNNRTIRDIANDYGIVQSTVYRIKTKAIEKIRCKCGI